MDSFQISVELGLSLLLLVTIFYSLYLGRALRRLRQDRQELDALLVSLQTSTSEAQAGIENLRQIAERTGRSLERSIESARMMTGELKGLYQQGDRRGRAQDLSAAEDGMLRPSIGSSRSPGSSIGKSAAERELLLALRAKQG